MFFLFFVLNQLLTRIVALERDRKFMQKHNSNKKKAKAAFKD